MEFLDDTNMNRELAALYSTMPQDLVQNILDFNAGQRLKPNSKGEVKVITKPFWLKVPDEYATARKRILMINQETYGWHHTFRVKSPEDLMQYYADFIERDVLGANKPSPVWVKFRNLRELALKYGAAIIASNIGKIGYVWESKYRYGCRGFKKKDVNYHPWVNEVFLKEIEILKPDMILFFSGPNYDEYIDRRFEDYGFPKPQRLRALADVESRKFARIEVPGFPPMYRTYHPVYLQRNARQPWAKAVVAEIERLIENL